MRTLLLLLALLVAPVATAQTAPDTSAIRPDTLVRRSAESRFASPGSASHDTARCAGSACASSLMLLPRSSPPTARAPAPWPVLYESPPPKPPRSVAAALGQGARTGAGVGALIGMTINHFSSNPVSVVDIVVVFATTLAGTAVGAAVGVNSAH